MPLAPMAYKHTYMFPPILTLLNWHRSLRFNKQYFIALHWTTLPSVNWFALHYSSVDLKEKFTMSILKEQAIDVHPLPFLEREKQW